MEASESKAFKAEAEMQKWVNRDKRGVITTLKPGAPESVKKEYEKYKKRIKSNKPMVKY